jgi:hypothetical protein
LIPIHKKVKIFQNRAVSDSQKTFPGIYLNIYFRENTPQLLHKKIKISLGFSSAAIYRQNKKIRKNPINTCCRFRRLPKTAKNHYFKPLTTRGKRNNQYLWKIFLAWLKGNRRAPWLKPTRKMLESYYCLLKNPRKTNPNKKK